MDKAVLYISYDGATDPLGLSQIVPYLIGLSKSGYSITLLSCEKEKNYERNQDEVKKTLGQANISWQPVFYRSSPPVLGPFLNFVALKSEAKKIVASHHPKLIHCRSYIPALIGLALKRKYGCKFLFDMRGFWVDERIEGNIWNKNNPVHLAIYRFFKRKEADFLKKADCTISLTQNAKEEILSWKNTSPNIEVIPCCADLDFFSPGSIQPEKLKELKDKLPVSENDFLLTYIGSIGTWYMLDEMLDFFKQLLLKKTNAKFLFVTPDDKAEIVKKAKAKNIGVDKIIVAAANRTEVPHYIALGNISIFLIRPTYSKKASSPTKMAEIMGMGIPIVCNNIGDLDKQIVSGKNGYLIEHFTNKDYQKAIDSIDALISIDKQQIRKTAMGHYSLDKGLELYNAVYEKLLGKKINQIDT